MRARLVVGIAVAALLFGAWWVVSRHGDDDVLVDARQNPAPSQQSSSPVRPIEVAPGTSSLPTPPMERRSRPLIVRVGAAVVVYGGAAQYRADLTISLQPLANGAVFDLESGRWATMASGPFPQPLYMPQGVVTSNGVVVVGTLCENHAASTEDDTRCHPATVGAGLYDPSSDEWHALASPDVVTDPGGAGHEVAPLIADGADAWFTIDGEAWIADAASGSWRRADVASPPVGKDRCRSDHTAIVLQASLVDPTDEQDSAFLHPRVFALTANEGWRDLGEPLGAAPSRRYRVVCMGEQVMVFSDGFVQAWMFDVPTGAQHAIEPPPGDVIHASVADALWTGDRLLLWDAGLASFAFEYDPATETWVRIDPGPAPDGIVWTGEWAFVFGVTSPSGTDGLDVLSGALAWKPTPASSVAFR